MRTNRNISPTFLRTALVTLGVLALFYLGPAGASASFVREPVSFSPIDGTGAGTAFSDAVRAIAIDETAGNVFVYTNGEIRILDREGGVPAGVAAPYKIVPASTGSNVSLAVDNAPGSPAQGTLYYSMGSKVFKFVRNPVGETYEAAGELAGSPALEGVNGITVDTHGNVFVATGNPLNELIKFNSGGTQVLRFTAKNASGDGYRPDSIAVDAAGDLFVSQENYNGANAGPSNFVWKYPANGSGQITQNSVILALQPLGLERYFGEIDVDPAANQLLVANVRDDDIRAYDATSLAQKLVFGAEYLSEVPGDMEVDAATGRVYVAEPGDHDVIVFSGELEAPDAVATSADTVGTNATLHGTVNPLGMEVTECRFEYGTTTAYGSSVPCEGALPVDSSVHPVSAELNGLVPNGVSYHFRVVAKVATATAKSADATFASADIFETGEASPLGQTTATLKGRVNPEGQALTECRFEYGLSTAYGLNAPCTPAYGSIPADSSFHAVSAAIAGLAENATYHFRIVATNSLGTFAGSDKAFTTTGPPLVFAESATPTGSTGATLSAQIDPRGAATTYHFEWGTDASYGNRIPAEGEFSAGSGSTPVEGTAALEGLAEGATYYYRVVAENARGTTDGPDQTFTTARANATCPNAPLRAGQASAALPEGPLALPGCMGFEMVTPPGKYNQDAYKPGFSAGGERVKFQSDAALADNPKVGGLLEHYVSSRGPEGWTTKPAGTPVDYTSGSGVNAVPCAYSPDLSHWSLWGSTASQAQLAITTAFRGGLDGSFVPLSPTLVPVDSGFGAFSVSEGSCEGSSADNTHEFIVVGTGKPAIYLPGDPRPAGTTAGIPLFNVVYEAYRDSSGTPTVELLTRDKDGVVYGGRCGAVVGGPQPFEARRGAISPDASRVYFSTRPDQPAALPCEGTEHGTRVMKRVRGPLGPEISEPVSSECTRVSPPCDTSEGDDAFEGASQEGDKFYFTTTRQLADSDLDTTADLYLYDGTRPSGSRLTQVSAGDASDPTQGKGAQVLGVADFSGDASHVYFVASGQLTAEPNRSGEQAAVGKPNLYLYERDAAHPDGRTAFIATLKPNSGSIGDFGDLRVWGSVAGMNEAAAVPVLGSDPSDESVGGDGHLLVFISSASLLPADGDDAADIYRFDADTGSLQLVSAALPGGSGDGPFEVSRIHEDVVRVSPNLLTFDRWVSEDGGTIVFSTEEGLSPKDGDGKPSVYVWRDGALSAIAVPSEMGTVSLSGDEVAFVTGSRLLPQDGDGAKDVYVARAGGGFPPPVVIPPCEGEACQGAPKSPPGEGASATSNFSGPGNVTATKPKPCRKGFVKKHGKCVRKHKKHKKHRGQSRGARGQGGGR